MLDKAMMSLCNIKSFFLQKCTIIGKIMLKKYKKAQEKMDEIGPVLSNYGNKVAKFVTSAPFRPELEKKFGAYLFQMYDASLSI